MQPLEKLSPAAAPFRCTDPSTVPETWRLATLSGRLVEVSGGSATAALTLTFRLVLEAQEAGEPVAWVTDRSQSFYPPDAAEGGVDLDALAVVRTTGSRESARAADLLLRSGGFGLVVLDLAEKRDLPLAAQSRLAGLARKHRAALLCITEKTGEAPSLGPLVSLRVEAERAARTGDRFDCRARVLKDKSRGAGREHLETCRAPDGLR